uniref:hypothetical protein n=1 Tax=uncultured Altererythrobacter sp. TaxID=500840 RepID=UPI0026207F6B|nr:hypothetical protein [uncultured Altererythrobacter sp.]
MRKLLVLVVLIVAGVSTAYYFGAFDRVTESRVERALVNAGVSPEMAECMAFKMVDRLNLIQLRKLEGLRAEEGESAVPLSGREALVRLERVDDPEALEVLVRAGGSCAIETLLS